MKFVKDTIVVVMKIAVLLVIVVTQCGYTYVTETYTVTKGNISYDIMCCEECGVTGKRYGLSRILDAILYLGLNVTLNAKPV